MRNIAKRRTWTRESCVVSLLAENLKSKGVSCNTSHAVFIFAAVDIWHPVHEKPSVAVLDANGLHVLCHHGIRLISLYCKRFGVLDPRAEVSAELPGILLVQDFDNSDVLSTNFVIKGSSLFILAADAAKNLRLYMYNPTDEMSWGGKKLLLK